MERIPCEHSILTVGSPESTRGHFEECPNEATRFVMHRNGSVGASCEDLQKQHATGWAAKEVMPISREEFLVAQVMES